MTDKQKDAAESSMQGLSVVDSLSNSKTGDTPLLAEHADCSKKEKVVVKVEPEAATNNDGCREGDCTEQLQAHTEKGPKDVAVPEISDSIKPVDVKEHLHNSTLIIGIDETLESTLYDDPLRLADDSFVKKEEKKPTTSDPKPEDLNKKPFKVKGKKDEHSYFWVSNISRHVKATDLKKFFSQLGKVLTAKILTNGKSYFGYVSMDSPDVAGKCIKQLNHSPFDGKKIVVSKDRPDLREAKVSVKMEPKKKRNEKFEGKNEELAAEPKTVPAATGKGDAKDKKGADDEIAKSEGVFADLRKRLDKSKAEIGRYKWKMVEFQRRHDGMRKKCDTLERELKEMQFKMRNERRRLNQDREQFDKTKKLEQIRFEADRVIMNKELDEVKKLREHLKSKIEEFKAQNKKVAKRRSRSPIIIRRISRGRSPLLRSNSSSAFRQDDRAEKKRKREEAARGRTPPPPPKLSNGLAKKRGDRGSENNVPSRPYFPELDKRPSSMGHEYEYRHKPYSQPQDAARIPWQAPYVKDTRRMNQGQAAAPTYPLDMRYGGGYQFNASNIAGPPRSYYPEFDKPYGHY